MCSMTVLENVVLDEYDVKCCGCELINHVDDMASCLECGMDLCLSCEVDHICQEKA